MITEDGPVKFFVILALLFLVLKVVNSRTKIPDALTELIIGIILGITVPTKTGLVKSKPNNIVRRYSPIQGRMTPMKAIMPYLTLNISFNSNSMLTSNSNTTATMCAKIWTDSVYELNQASLDQLLFLKAFPIQ